MNQAVKISLITKTYTINEIGVSEAKESTKELFAVKHSISQSEFYSAGLQGFKPEARYDVLLTEYAGQDELEENGNRFTIYRTYDREDGRIELYATQRKGSK